MLFRIIPNGRDFTSPESAAVIKDREESKKDRESIILEPAVIFQYHERMIGKKITVAGDGHFHLYPCHDLAGAISNLVNNLDRLAASARGLAQEEDCLKIAFLAESKQDDCFHKILQNELSFKTLGLEVAAGPEAHCVSLSKQGKLLFSLVAGRQIVTREKLEVLGLGMEEIVPDGLPAEKAIEKVTMAGGLPVLAFSPGKWFFKRGQVALKLIEHYGNSLLIGDSALRPIGWAAPEIMRLARARGTAIFPGSDPLPLAGEEKYSGCYGFIYQGSFDISRPLTSMKEIIANSPAEIRPAGRRRSMTNVAVNLLRLRRFKERHIGA